MNFAPAGACAPSFLKRAMPSARLLASGCQENVTMNFIAVLSWIGRDEYGAALRAGCTKVRRRAARSLHRDRGPVGELLARADGEHAAEPQLVADPRCAGRQRHRDRRETR